MVGVLELMALSLLDEVDQLIDNTEFDAEKSETLQRISELKKNLLSSHNIKILTKCNFTRNSSIFNTLHHSDLLIYGYCRQYRTNAMNADIIDFILTFYQILRIEMITLSTKLDIKPNINGKVEIISKSYGFKVELVRGDIPIVILPNKTTRNDISTCKKYYEFIVGELSWNDVRWTDASIGFCDDECSPYGYGVPYNPHSWAFDGSKVKKLGGGQSVTYGQKWKINDVVGCCIDMHYDGKDISCNIGFYLNGKYLGDAFMGQQCSGNIYPAGWFSPGGIGTERNNESFGTMVFDKDQFKYNPTGYEAII